MFFLIFFSFSFIFIFFGFTYASSLYFRFRFSSDDVAASASASRPCVITGDVAEVRWCEEVGEPAEPPADMSADEGMGGLYVGRAEGSGYAERVS